MASKGSQIVSENVRTTKNAESGIYTHGVTAAQQNGPTATGVFPRGGLQARDARDELVSEKKQMMNANGMSPFGQVNATDADFEWLRKKREADQLANFDSWAGENFHTADPATRKWHQEINPEYYEARERLMVDRAKLALRIKLMKLRGPKNEKDLMLWWALQTGRVQLDRDWDVVGPYNDGKKGITQSTEQKRFKDGLFSIRRYPTNVERAQAINNVSGSGYNNPFATPTTGAGGNQLINSPFPGVDPTVGTSRYPHFLNNSLAPYL